MFLFHDVIVLTFKVLSDGRRELNKPNVEQTWECCTNKNYYATANTYTGVELQCCFVAFFGISVALLNGKIYTFAQSKRKGRISLMAFSFLRKPDENLKLIQRGRGLGI